MKTTVELPDDLLTRAKSFARRRGWTVKLVLEESLRAYLDRDAPEAGKTFRLRHATVDGQGLQDPSMSFEDMLALANPARLK